MPDESQLTPVFMPPLAAILAIAEQKKGSPLDSVETVALRDKATCIMMSVADAEKMAGPRGYRDVNPQNLWADWHRLRPQMTGGYLPKIILCIPGDDGLRKACEPILNAAGIEHEFRPHDPKLARAFKTGAMTWRSLTDQELARIAGHTTVLYVLSKNFTPAGAAGTAQSMLSLGRQLLDAGGFAIKCESSGIAHPPAVWSALADRAASWGSLFRGYVLYPIGSADLYTCGMHLLGVPDLIIAESVLQGITAADSNTATTASRLFAAFGFI
jgi:hypothetical protein